MTAAELAIVARCCRAICFWCSHPAYQAAERDLDGNWHHPHTERLRGTNWCDASLIWEEFADERILAGLPAAAESDAPSGQMPLGEAVA